MGWRTALATVFLLGLVAVPGRAHAAEPPNRDDPCSVAGKNTCGTNGVGFHKTYRYGVRWFGDYKGVVAGSPRGFCIDLRYWYPAPRHEYREDTSNVLRNRDREIVPVEARRRIAYAIWEYGRSTKPTQQAAVMLYVHALMGDARPGEVDPKAIGPAVASIYADVERDAARYHGPYRVQVTMPAKLRPGQAGKAAIRVLAASGAALPRTVVDIAAEGVRGAPQRATTDASGVATVPFTAGTGEVARLTATARGLAATLPRIYAPTTPEAKPNGQRLAIPSAQEIEGGDSTTIVRSTVSVSTQATPSVIVVGGESRDKVTIARAAPGWSVVVQVKLHGPFRTEAGITCNQPPVWEGRFKTKGSGAYTTPAARLERPGWYVYRLVVPADSTHAAVTTPCGDVHERVKVEAQPRVRTVISDRTATLDTPIFDRILVTGLAGEQGTVRALLYGPYAKQGFVKCGQRPVWSGTVRVTGDGEYRTAPVRLETPGWYTYVERLESTTFVRAAETGCGEVAETTFAQAKPTVTTVASSEVIVPGSTLRDRVRVSGLGSTPAQVEVQLFGPFATRAAITCAGTPVWSGRVSVRGDGTYRTAPANIAKAGFYAYRERLLAQPLVAGTKGECGADSETALARPLVLTGRGDPSTRHLDAKTPSQTALFPARVRLEARGIDAPSVPVGIDLARGALAAPSNIRRLGWWRDGAAPGSQKGSVLIAGHVDSAREGAGALYRLREAKRGDLVEVETAGGRTFTYRVTAVRRYVKNKLPVDIYSRKGAPRLVLVTCGGPFLESDGAYRDNVVLTAVPVRRAS